MLIAPLFKATPPTATPMSVNYDLRALFNKCIIVEV
jgi:hypothetical protein